VAALCAMPEMRRAPLMRLLIPLGAVMLLYAGFDGLGALMLLGVGLFWGAFWLTAAHMTWQEWRDERKS
jgi:hypothetical protein